MHYWRYSRWLNPFLFQAFFQWAKISTNIPSVSTCLATACRLIWKKSQGYHFLWGLLLPPLILHLHCLGKKGRPEVPWESPKIYYTKSSCSYRLVEILARLFWESYPFINTHLFKNSVTKLDSFMTEAHWFAKLIKTGFYVIGTSVMKQLKYAQTKGQILERLSSKKVW